MCNARNDQIWLSHECFVYQFLWGICQNMLFGLVWFPSDWSDDRRKCFKEKGCHCYLHSPTKEKKIRRKRPHLKAILRQQDCVSHSIQGYSIQKAQMVTTPKSHHGEGVLFGNITFVRNNPAVKEMWSLNSTLITDKWRDILPHDCWYYCLIDSSYGRD